MNDSTKEWITITYKGTSSVQLIQSFKRNWAKSSENAGAKLDDPPPSAQPGLYMSYMRALINTLSCGFKNKIHTQVWIYASKSL